MMKKMNNKKKSSAIIAALVISIIGVGVLGYNTVFADRRLTGLDTLIQKKTSATETFQILEIVEDQGEIGFYFDGNEPFSHDADGYALSFEETLANLPDTVERNAYIKDLETRLSGKYLTKEEAGEVGNAEKYPLIYNGYQETYFPTDKSAWDYIEFETSNYVELAGEYVAVEPAADGTVNGDYTKNDTYMLAYDYYDSENDIHHYNGEYVENLAGFDGASTAPAYRVQFGTNPVEKYLSLGVYVKEYLPAGQVSTQAAFDSLQAQNGGKYWKQSEESYVEVDLSSLTFADLEGAVLYTENYKYAGATDDDSSKTFYYVQEYAYAYDGLNYNGQYGAILKNGEAQYVKKAEGQEGTHKLSEYLYSCTPGVGNYNFVENSEKPTVPVEIRGVYYTGGFINNNWFRKNVFLSSVGNIELNLFPVKIRTLTVDQLIKECRGNVGVFNNIDLLVINGKSTMFDKEGQATTSILANVAEKLRSEIEVNKVATIVNRQIVTGKGSSTIVELLKGYFTSEKTSSIGSVDKNIYWFEGDLLNLNFATKLSEEEANSGFEDVLTYIEAENKYLELREGEELISEDISQAVAIQYILSCKYARNAAPKENLTVLEIEPCADYFLTPDEVRKMTGYDDMKDDAIEIVQMTTAEFVGKIHDLNGEYDFIYFGMETGLMNTSVSTGETVYNDKDMNGLVYTHTGDAVIAAERLTGLLETDFVDDDTSNLPYSKDVYMIRTAKNDAGELVLNQQTIKNFSINTPNKDEVKKDVAVGNQGVYRYSGNDITAENIEQLMDYVKAGYPVIFDNDFAIAGTTNDKKTANSINTSKVDNSSCLYTFLKEVFEEENVFLYSDALSTNEEFKFYMNLPKLQLTFYKNANDGSSSEYYIENTDVKEHYTDDSEVFVKMVDGKYYLTYVLSIEDKASASVLDTNYKVSLFIDINSDGKYSREHEMMTDITVVEEDGITQVAADELVAGEKYIVTRRIPDAFRSIVPWKLEVSLTTKDTTTTGENDATQVLKDRLSYIRKSQYGYSKLRTDEKTDILIYQILSDPKGKNGQDTNTWNLQKDYEDRNSQFRQDVDSVNEYNLDFTTSYVKDYQKLTNEELEKANNDRADAYFNKLQKYDMLILGFSDVYEGFSDQYAVEAILRFIETGKTVLFTHDTTSFVNYPGDTVDNIEGKRIFWDNSDKAIGGSRWGYLLNQIVRDKLGMDRYGITNADNYIKENADTISATDGLTIDEAKSLLESLLKKGQILDTTQKVSEYIATDYDGTVDELINFADKDAAYVAGSNKAQTYPETHGYTYTALNNCVDLLGENEKNVSDGGKRVLTGTHTTYLNLNDDSGVTNLGRTWSDTFKELFDGIFGNDSIIGSWINSFIGWIGDLFDKYLGMVHNGSFDTMEISCVNRGQITEYPFKIDDTLQVASTHAQYYQLDLEADQDNDGESDIVVWYCISDGYDGSMTKANPYSASPNDVRNNYYIYSIGNVFYTGAGHKTVNRQEKQLFINTIIAAYNASVNEPSVNVLESENILAAEMSSVNMPLEYSLATKADQSAYIGDTEIQIPYSVYDDNFVYASDTVKTLSVEYFIEDANGSETINGVTVKPLDNIATTQNGVAVDTIESGQAYTAVWKPTGTELYDYISNHESVHIFVRVKSSFVYNGELTTLYGYDTLALKKTNMFELD